VWRYELYGNLWLIRKILSGGVQDSGLRGVGVVAREANVVEGPGESRYPSVVDANKMRCCGMLEQ
jgi:hypothetical protein